MNTIKSGFCLVILLFLLQAGYAQEKVNLEVGDTLVFLNPQDKIAYRYMDIFVKTRVVNTDRTYNKENGEGFYDFFFNSGDFDMQRLPASYKAKTCRLVSFREMDDKDKTKPSRMVAFGEIDERTVVWIEIDKALQSGEIGLKP